MNPILRVNTIMTFLDGDYATKREREENKKVLAIAKIYFTAFLNYEI